MSSLTDDVSFSWLPGPPFEVEFEQEQTCKTARSHDEILGMEYEWNRVTQEVTVVDVRPVKTANVQQCDTIKLMFPEGKGKGSCVFSFNAKQYVIPSSRYTPCIIYTPLLPHIHLVMH